MPMVLSPFRTTLNVENKIYWGTGAPTNDSVFRKGDLYFRTDVASGQPLLYVAQADGGTFEAVATSGAIAPAGGTVAAVAGAATLNFPSGKVTTESLNTAAAGTYTLTLTNNKIAATSLAFVSIENGSNTQGDPVLGLVSITGNTLTVKIVNRHASQALNGTMKINFLIVNPS